MIFDSLVHPTISGNFLGCKGKSNFSEISKGLRDQGVIRACAVGIAGIEDYSHEAFFNECQKYDNLFPVAGIDFNKNLKNEFSQISKIGYSAIKIHPRLMGGSFSITKLVESFNLAFDNNIVVFLCTYNFTSLYDKKACLNYESLVEALSRSNRAKVVLVHGGTVELLKYSELVRNNTNLLLDLSFTFMKYSQSSVDLDIMYLFEKFDRRICIGSDFPDFGFKEVCEKFNSFTNGLDKEKIKNIAYNNLESFLGRP